MPVNIKYWSSYAGRMATTTATCHKIQFKRTFLYKVLKLINKNEMLKLDVDIST